MPGFSVAQVVNAALEMIASQSQITSLTDGTPAAKYAAVIYAPTVQLMLREIDPAFARFTAALTIAVNPPNYPPWAWEYTYPADCVRLRQVGPPGSGTGALADPNDPRPIRSQVGFDVIAEYGNTDRTSV